VAYRDPNQKRVADAEYRLTHLAEASARQSKYRLENREKERIRNAKYRLENSEKVRASRSITHAKHPKKAYARKAKRRAAKLQRVPRWADLKAIQAFIVACPSGWAADHIIPLQGKLVSGLHVLNNLQYLTRAENSAKGNRYDP
jgi:5-methylcytosine-specific restriction endonuclease McrA